MHPPDPQPAADPGSRAQGWLLGIVLGLLLFFGVRQLTQQPPPGPPDELPQLAVVAEVEDLADPASRAALAALERGLSALPVQVQGPLDYPLLLPARMTTAAEPAGPQPQGAAGSQAPELLLPQARGLDELDAAAWAAAAPYLPVGGYLAPRIYTPDARRVVLRVRPQKATFPPQLAAQVQRVLDAHRDRFRALHAYSRALGLVDEEARGVIDRDFGVQTVVVELELEDPGATWDPERLGPVRDAARAPLPEARTVATALDYPEYAHAVVTASPQGAGLPPAAQVPALQLLARAVPRLIGRDGRATFVEVGTTAQGPANLALERALAARLGALPGVRARALRDRGPG